MFLKKYRYEILVSLLTFAISVLIFCLNSVRYPNDDQFIVYRYIDNLVSGKGLVFNVGERVMGFTSPLFTLVGALFKYILPNVYTPDIISWINIFLFSFSAIFFYKICKRFLSSRLSVFAVLVYALDLSRTIPEGMETPLFLFFTFIFLDTLLSEKYYVSSVFLSLAILTRPDAGLIALLALIFWWQKTGFQKTAKLVAVCAAVALPWLIFSTLYYGSFIPQSLMAKLQTGDIVNQSQFQALKVQLSDISRLFWGKIFDPDNIPLQAVFNLLPIFVLMYFGAKKRMSKDNWIIFAIPVLYLVSLSISNPVMWPWYLSQTEPFWILASILGLVYLLEKTKSKNLKIIALVLILIGPLYWWTGRLVSLDRGSKEPLHYAAQYLKENIEPGETIGINNLGIIGYETGAYIYDFFGLMNYTSAAFYPVKECGDKSVQYQVPGELIMHARPDWLVLSGHTEITPCFRDSRWFKENYVPEPGTQGMEIYKLVKDE